MSESGEWYIIVTCNNCKAKLKLFRDLNKGRSLFKGSYIVTCPKCKHEGAYEAEHYHHTEIRKPEILIDIA